MLSGLYEINPHYYEEFIGGITEDSGQYQVIPSFLQQTSNRGEGVIDGHIKIKASSVIIETKIHGLEWINKLLKYTKSFNENEYKLLFHISSKRYPENELDDINNRLKENKLTENVNFHSLTYRQLVDQLKELVASYPYEPQLNRIWRHFEEYCLNMNLMPRSQHILRAMACGQSFDLNVKHKFYFDLASRGYSAFNYLGIYKWKAVRFIGKVENVVEADWTEVDGLLVKNSSSPVTDSQKNKLINAIEESIAKGWYVGQDHRFFLFDEFYETRFRKTSPGGIFRVRYFDLEQILESQDLKDLSTIAKRIEQFSWT